MFTWTVGHPKLRWHCRSWWPLVIKAVLVFVCDLQWARQQNIDSFFVLNRWLIVWFQVLDGWVLSCGD